jgi:hypothetical protein
LIHDIFGRNISGDFWENVGFLVKNKNNGF